MTEVSAEAVQGVLNGIADDIERYGHYQGLSKQTLWSVDRTSGQCCLLVNPTRLMSNIERDLVLDEMERRIRAIVGEDMSFTYFSDNYPTDEVLAMLRGTDAAL